MPTEKREQVRVRQIKNLRLSDIPTAGGGISRAAYALASDTKLSVGSLLRRANLSLEQAKNPRLRIAVGDQIKFLNLVADELDDEFLGIRLAQTADLREVGLVYYVMASSETLGEALQRVARYSTIQNEGVRIGYRPGNPSRSHSTTSASPAGLIGIRSSSSSRSCCACAAISAGFH